MDQNLKKKECLDFLYWNSIFWSNLHVIKIFKIIHVVGKGRERKKMFPCIDTGLIKTQKFVKVTAETG